MDAKVRDGSVAVHPGVVRSAVPQVRGRFTVLVVDADRESRDLYRQCLVLSGCSVCEASDGREALVQVFRVQPHAVIVDARLPYIDGLQLCTLLRRDASTASVRIVGIVSDMSADLARRFRERGADLVFAKPVSIDDLVTALVTLESSGARPQPAAPAPTSESTPRVAAKARLHERYVSSTPPAAPPRVRCPQCDALLQYDRSHVGGVSDRHPEQWDYFVCARHGVFQYRHRTRKLRPAS